MIYKNLFVIIFLIERSKALYFRNEDLANFFSPDLLEKELTATQKEIPCIKHFNIFCEGLLRGDKLAKKSE